MIRCQQTWGQYTRNMLAARKKIGGETRQSEFTTPNILNTIKTTVIKDITSQIHYMAITRIKAILDHVLATGKKSGQMKQSTKTPATADARSPAEGIHEYYTTVKTRPSPHLCS